MYTSNDGGAQQHYPPPPNSPHGPYLRQQTNLPRTPPKSWLIESILVTIFCCSYFPITIIGIVYATKVESRFYAGDYEGALAASREAARWTKIGFFGSILLAVIIPLMVIFGVISTAYFANVFN